MLEHLDMIQLTFRHRTLSYNELRRVASQNCHSYALERYSKYHSIIDNELFTSTPVVTENRRKKNEYYAT